MVRNIGNDTPERKVIDNIAKYGWHCVNVLAEGKLPAYSFTVGIFHTYKHPELIIFGLPSEVAHQVLELAVSALNSGAITDLSLPTNELLNGYPCVFVQVPEVECVKGNSPGNRCPKNKNPGRPGFLEHLLNRGYLQKLTAWHEPVTAQVTLPSVPTVGVMM